MPWPDWIDALRDRYLADAGNVFLLHGALDARWPVDGEALDVQGVLVRFLSRTRQVVGVVRPGEPLSFPNLGDRGRFERLVTSHEVVTNQRLSRDAATAEEALGLAWASLCGTGIDQAWIVHDLHHIVPGHRKRVEPLGGDAPALWEWPRRLAQTNDIVILLAPTPASVRVEIAEVAVKIEVSPPPVRSPEPVRASEPSPPPLPQVGEAAASEPESPERTELPELAPAVASAPPPPADDTATLEAIHAALEDALQAALAEHPVETWESRLPVLSAVARVLASQEPSLGALELSLEEGALVAADPAAEAFLARWRSDIALDAAAGMLLRAIELPEGATHVEPPVPLDPTALRALAKRTRRMLS